MTKWWPVTVFALSGLALLGAAQTVTVNDQILQGFERCKSSALFRSLARQRPTHLDPEIQGIAVFAAQGRYRTLPVAEVWAGICGSAWLDRDPKARACPHGQLEAIVFRVPYQQAQRVLPQYTQAQPGRPRLTLEPARSGMSLLICEPPR
ncbi:MAG: hypothetical protein NZ482_01570 [Gloeomargarita sp. SKYG98]|nr:hypothetical protein [Gloeomargarita sp. SKYG98]